jgi:hypothetical protein
VNSADGHRRLRDALKQLDHANRGDLLNHIDKLERILRDGAILVWLTPTADDGEEDPHWDRNARRFLQRAKELLPGLAAEFGEGCPDDEAQDGQPARAEP